MFKFSDAETFVIDTLDPKDYETPLVLPGPVSSAQLQGLSPGAVVFAAVGNGAGMTGEEMFDRVFLTLRVIGEQGSYESAETIAQDLDRALLALGGNTKIGATRTLGVFRTGGAPMLIDYDNADRYHFQTTYVVTAQTEVYSNG